ncbi:hypothetical protein [Streptosporangium sp. NPDC051022]|uniref:hypothetical protein n=1 Tax=Streptosporangium sp. NPDC051022 TaxID=3155752 RepID=UPI00341A1565
MTDWSSLSHAYGSAEDIPSLLDRIETDPSDEDWSGLRSALCHQGTVYSASFAALPRLTAIAVSGAPDAQLHVLFLAGAIMAGADQPHGAGEVRATYAAEIAELLRMANGHLRTLRNRTGYLYLLEAVLGLEGVPVWSEELAWELDSGEYEVSCPDCETDLFIVIGDHGCFSTAGDHALEDDVEKAPLRPTAPGDLYGIGRRLHDIALADGHPDIATAMTYLFGNARCTDCGADFLVADRVGDV